MTETTLKEEKRNQAVLVGLNAHSLPPEDNATETTLEELAALLETAGGECVGTVLQNKDKPDARTFIGEGKVDEVRELAQAVDADLIVFDNEISPAQVRVLTEDIGVQVMDRAGLILDIFAQRARTREGRLQVALAQYKYLLPRLTGMWGHLVRQTASGGKSPIGTRGPGETQLETDRRHIRRKIQKLEEDLQALAKAFLLLKTEEECTAFLKDVCTYQELRALSQRLHVARLLRKQYVFHEIVQETGASTATISRVNRTLRDSTGGYQAVLERMEPETDTKPES